MHTEIIPRSTLSIPTTERRIHSGNSASPAPGVPARKPQHVPKGHDAILKALQDKGSLVDVAIIGGEPYRGKMVNRDRYTITVQCADGRNHTIYKHAIESFSPVVPA